MEIEAGMFVVEKHTGKVALIEEIESEGRWLIEYENEERLSNAPAYLFREATEAEIEAAIQRRQINHDREQQ